MATILKNFADLDSDRFRKGLTGLAGLGGVLGAAEILLLFLPEAPSKEEIAIKDAVRDITKRMNEIHETQMASLSQIV